jgi:hypothetical protein
MGFRRLKPRSHAFLSCRVRRHQHSLFLAVFLVLSKIGDTFAGIKAKRCSLSTMIFLKNKATISKWMD